VQWGEMMVALRADQMVVVTVYKMADESAVLLA